MISELVSELVLELVSELVSELIPKLIGDPDGCPLTVGSLAFRSNLQAPQ